MVGPFADVSDELCGRYRPWRSLLKLSVKAPFWIVTSIDCHWRPVLKESRSLTLITGGVHAEVPTPSGMKSNCQRTVGFEIWMSEAPFANDDDPIDVSSTY